MESSKLGCRVWAIALYQMTTGLKGAASMKLYRDLKVTQKGNREGVQHTCCQRGKGQTLLRLPVCC